MQDTDQTSMVHTSRLNSIAYKTPNRNNCCALTRTWYATPLLIIQYINYHSLTIWDSWAAMVQFSEQIHHKSPAMKYFHFEPFRIGTGQVFCSYGKEDLISVNSLNIYHGWRMQTREKKPKKKKTRRKYSALFNWMLNIK